jgi:acetyl esterase/lipase
MDMDREYANAAFIPGADAFPPRWAADAAAFRATARGQTDIAYGPGARQRFDLFLPEGTPRGLVVFVHGGYWLRFGRGDWSHLAAGPVARGWAVALPSYTLAPAARIAAITAEIGAAVAVAAGMVAGPIVMTGHSAGGHLSARMGNADAPLPPAVAARVVRVVPISPLADLAPLMATAMNRDLGIDAAEAAAESPARHPLRPGVAAHVWIGGQERPAFLWQARTLAEAWACPWTVDAGRHHFDVIDPLARADSDLIETLIGGL